VDIKEYGPKYDLSTSNCYRPKVLVPTQGCFMIEVIVIREVRDMEGLTKITPFPYHIKRDKIPIEAIG
jgi:hypothetical protein